MSICKGCKAKITWVMAITKNGIKPHPCDPEFYNRGNLPPVNSLLLSPITNNFRKSNTEGYISHYATCPVADNFRKKNK